MFFNKQFYFLKKGVGFGHHLYVTRSVDTCWTHAGQLPSKTINGLVQLDLARPCFHYSQKAGACVPNTKCASVSHVFHKRGSVLEPGNTLAGSTGLKLGHQDAAPCETGPDLIKSCDSTCCPSNRDSFDSQS